MEVVDEQQEALVGRRAEQILALGLERALHTALQRRRGPLAGARAHRRADEAAPRLLLLVLAPIQRVEQLHALADASRAAEQHAAAWRRGRARVRLRLRLRYGLGLGFGFGFELGMEVGFGRRLR